MKLVKTGNAVYVRHWLKWYNLKDGALVGPIGVKKPKS